MLGLFFDVKPKPGHMVHYFEHVDRLKPVLARHEGLLYLERFRPLDDADALLSHQHWRDEEALGAWRREARHRASQSAGRRIHFEDYRIRVGTAISSSGTEGRAIVTAVGSTGYGGRIFESVTRPGVFLSVIESEHAEDAAAAAEKARSGGACEVHVFAILRDYSLSNRMEAPRD